MGHFVAKCPLKNSSGYNSNQRREIYPKKKSFFTKTGSDSFEDEDEFDSGKNEIVFMEVICG